MISMVLRGDVVAKTNLITIEEAFVDSTLPAPPGPIPLWGPGPIPDDWADVCEFGSFGGHQPVAFEKETHPT